jgi:hypothetical protein
MTKTKAAIALAILAAIAACTPIGIITAPIDAAATVTGAIL